MSTLLCALLAPAFVPSAAAATNEISFEVGWLGANDPAFDTFGGGGVLASAGLRVGYAVHPNIAIIGGWQHAANGATTEIVDVSDASATDYYESTSTFQAALYTDQVTLGSKADVKLLKWLHPYVAAQLVGMRGLARLDDDAQDDANLTQVQRAGLTGGFMGTAGLDFLIHTKGRVAIAPYLELGYGWLAPMRMGDLGTVQFSGFTGRTGVGVRF